MKRFLSRLNYHHLILYFLLELLSFNNYACISSGKLKAYDPTIDLYENMNNYLELVRKFFD